MNDESCPTVILPLATSNPPTYKTEITKLLPTKPVNKIHSNHLSTPRVEVTNLCIYGDEDGHKKSLSSMFICNQISITYLTLSHNV